MPGSGRYSAQARLRPPPALAALDNKRYSWKPFNDGTKQDLARHHPHLVGIE